MELEMLAPGRYKPEEIVIAGPYLMWAKIKGKCFALNYRSHDPLNMRNREERAAFARAIGVSVKEVEAYVRRIKRARAKDALAEELRDARALLQQNGYNVIDTKDR